MTETLRLRQSSMEYDDPKKAVVEDLKDAIPDAKARNAPDFIGFTEANAAIRRLIKQRCDEAGYGYVHASTVAIAVHPRHQVLSHGCTQVLDGQKTPSGKGSYSSRPVLEVTVLTPDGNEVTVHEAHWITSGHGVERRIERQVEQSKVMADRVRLNGRGDAMSFWMGDTNSDEAKKKDRVQKVLTRGHLVSVYDALNKYPNTHGKKTIDVIGHYDHDGRVVPKSVVVGKVRNSDHRKVDAVYVIGGSRKR